MSDLHRLIYASHSRLPVGSDVNRAVEDIVAVSQRNNARVGVTGLLLHHENLFVQALEGPRATVNEVYRRVEQDLRHDKLRLIDSTPANERLFGAWSMCARTLRPGDARILSIVGAEVLDISTLEAEATLNLLCAVAQMQDLFRRAA